MYHMFLGSQKIQLPKLLSTRKKKTSETAQDLGDYKTSIRTLSFLLTPFNLRHRIQFKVKKMRSHKPGYTAKEDLTISHHQDKQG